jgi:hypothetical protein
MPLRSPFVYDDAVPPTVNYARPQTPEGNPVLAQMRAQEAGSAGLGMTILLIGAGVTLLTVFVIATVIVAVLHALLGTSYIGFTGWMLVTLVALVPYLIHLERRTRGEFYADTVLGSGQDWGNASSHGEYQMQNMTATAAMYGDLALTGPRLLLGGWQRIKGLEARQFNAFLARCAEAVYVLAAAGEAVPAQRLAAADESPKAFDRVLNHLEKRDWIGHSSDRRRVWLSGKAKADLVKLGVPLGGPPA